MKTLCLVLFLFVGCFAPAVSAGSMSSVSCTIGNQTVTNSGTASSMCSVTASLPWDPSVSGIVSASAISSHTSDFITGNVFVDLESRSISPLGFGTIKTTATTDITEVFSTGGPVREGFLTATFDFMNFNGGDEITISDGQHTYSQAGCFVDKQYDCLVTLTDQPFLLGSAFTAEVFSTMPVDFGGGSGADSDYAAVSFTLNDGNAPISVYDRPSPIPEPAAGWLAGVGIVSWLGFSKIRTRVCVS